MSSAKFIVPAENRLCALLGNKVNLWIAKLVQRNSWGLEAHSAGDDTPIAQHTGVAPGVLSLLHAGGLQRCAVDPGAS
jgi:hypothetical protein